MGNPIAKLDSVAVVSDDHPVLSDADVLGDLRMQGQVAELAVDRHEEPGPHQVEHQFQLFTAGVTGGMHAVAR